MSESLEKQLRQLKPQPLGVDFTQRVGRALERANAVAANSVRQGATPTPATGSYSFSDRCLMGMLSLAAIAAGVILVCVVQDGAARTVAPQPPIMADSPHMPTMLDYQRAVAGASWTRLPDGGM